MKIQNKNQTFFHYSLFFIFFILFVMFMKWCGDRPSLYLDDIECEFSGRVIEKYFQKSTNCIIKTKTTKKQISGLSKELVNKIEIGDSLIKFENSNCSLLIKDSAQFYLKYIYIPENVLKKSDYLRKIYERDCN